MTNAPTMFGIQGGMEEFYPMTIIGEPVPKGRPRMGKGHVYTPVKTALYEDLIAWMSKPLPRYTEQLILYAEFYCTPRLSLPDVDNLVKSLLDGLQKGGCIANDNLVAEIHAKRIMSKIKPRVRFCLVRLDNPGSGDI